MGRWRGGGAVSYPAAPGSRQIDGESMPESGTAYRSLAVLSQVLANRHLFAGVCELIKPISPPSWKCFRGEKRGQQPAYGMRYMAAIEMVDTGTLLNHCRNRNEIR